MSESKQSGYLLLSRTDEWYKQLSHAELQKLIADNQAWVGRLMAEGKARPGVALAREGATVSGNKRVVLDGPFAESKEAIGGYFYLQVADEAEAVAIARQCPGLEYGSVVEVRPVAEMCSVRARAVNEGIITAEIYRETVGAR